MALSSTPPAVVRSEDSFGNTIASPKPAPRRNSSLTPVSGSGFNPDTPHPAPFGPSQYPSWDAKVLASSSFGSYQISTVPFGCPFSSSRNFLESIRRGLTLFATKSTYLLRANSESAASFWATAKSLSTRCCAALASDAAVWSPATFPSATEARSFCFSNSVRASVSFLSKSLNSAAWRSFIRFVVITTPPPKINVRKSSITPPYSKIDFHNSNDIRAIPNRSFELFLQVVRRTSADRRNLREGGHPTCLHQPPVAAVQNHLLIGGIVG